MKKILLSLMLFIGVFTIVACSCNKDDEPAKASLSIGDMSVTTYSEIEWDDLKKKIDNDETFILYVYTKCTACDIFKTILDNVISEKHLSVYAINDIKIDNKHELGSLSTSPALVVYNNGEILAKSDYSENKDYFVNKDGLLSFINKYTNMPTMYYITKQQLDAKIENNEKFIIYYSRSSCGDCDYLNTHYLKEYLSKNYNTKYFYIIETDAEGIRFYNGASPNTGENATEDELAAASQWQTFKDNYGLSNASNPLGHGVGYVPTFQYYENGEVKDMVVYFNDWSTYLANDGAPLVKIDSSYYSDHPYLNQSILYSEYHDTVAPFYNEKLKTFLDTNLSKVD